MRYIAAAYSKSFFGHPNAVKERRDGTNQQILVLNAVAKESMKLVGGMNVRGSRVTEARAPEDAKGGATSMRTGIKSNGFSHLNFTGDMDGLMKT